MNNRHDDNLPATPRLLDRYWWVFSIAIGLLLFWCIRAMAATSSEDTVTVQLKRGTTLVTLIPSPITLADCEQRKAGLVAIDAETKFSGTGTYSCIETRRSVVTFTANPPPPPPPAPVDCVVSEWGAWVQGTPSACVAGSQTRVDNRTRTIVTQPANGGAACPSLSESVTQTLTCTVTPPPPTGIAAPVVTSTTTANAVNPANSDVKLSWNALAGATSYKLQRCTGAACNASFMQLAWAAPLTYTNNNLPAGFTFGYRVQGTNSSSQGQWSAVLYVTTPTNTGPPPPPPPPATGTASLAWTHDGKNTAGAPVTLAGFRVIYGPAPNAMTQLVTVPNPAARTYIVDKLASGTWYFAVRAYTATGGESDQSNVASKAIP